MKLILGMKAVMGLVFLAAYVTHIYTAIMAEA